MNTHLDTATAEDTALKALLTRGAILAYRLVNTIYASSFLKSLDHPFKINDEYQCDGARLMEDRLIYAIKRATESRTSDSTHADMVHYLDRMTTKLDLGLKAKDKKGVIKELSALESDEVQQLVYKMAAIESEHRYEYRTDVHSFNTHEVLYELRTFLVARTSLTSGIAHKGLHQQFITQLAKHPAEYFRLYTVDLFDYAQRMVLTHKRAFVAWHPEWLSIDVYFDENETKRDYSERDVYLVEA